MSKGDKVLCINTDFGILGPLYTPLLDKLLLGGIYTVRHICPYVGGVLLHEVINPSYDSVSGTGGCNEVSYMPARFRLICENPEVSTRRQLELVR